MRALLRVFVCSFGVALGRGGPTYAQIQFTGPPVLTAFSDDQFSSYELDSSLPPPILAATESGFTVKGDVNLRHDRMAPAPPEGFWPVLQMIVKRPFTVGPLPVRELREQLEAVLANGTAVAPQMEFRTPLMFFINDGGFPFIREMDVWMDTTGTP